MKYDILIYGALFCDLIFTELPAMPEPGREIFAGDFTIAIGGSAIVAVALQRLGASVGLIAELGNDHLSNLARGLMQEQELDLSLIREHSYPLPQVSVALSTPKDRAFVTRFEKPSAPRDLTRIIEENRARHLHVSSFLAVLDQPDAAQIAHRAGLTVSLDPGWDEEGLRDPRLLAMIPELDFFLPSASEACHITQTDSPEAALTALSERMHDGVVVMKNGKDGVIAQRDTEQVRMDSLPVSPVDTTGAGDSFDAGFLYAHSRGKSLRDCLKYGVICGALATTAPGGATATPTLEEIKKWLPKLPS